MALESCLSQTTWRLLQEKMFPWLSHQQHCMARPKPQKNQNIWESALENSLRDILMRPSLTTFHRRRAAWHWPRQQDAWALEPVGFRVAMRPGKATQCRKAHE